MRIEVEFETRLANGRNLYVLAEGRYLGAEEHFGPEMEGPEFRELRSYASDTDYEGREETPTSLGAEMHKIIEETVEKLFEEAERSEEC